MNTAPRLAAALVALALLSSGAMAAEPEGRRILVCVAADAAPALRDAARALVRDAAQVPALSALVAIHGAGAAELQDSAALLDDKAWRHAAFDHLVVIGLPGRDALLDKVWGYATRLDAVAHSAYAEGYGHLQGDLGLVESGRNPFLHSQRIDSNPFDTCVVKLSGTSEAGVLTAVQAFRSGLLNGLVPAGAVTRAMPSLLDLDPLPAPPPSSPSTLGPLHYAGWTQCAGDEYRAFIDVGGAEPRRLWRMKYLAPGSWNAIGAKGWLAGFERRSFGSAVDVAEFADAATAARVAASLAKNGKPIVVAGHPASELAPAKDEAIDPGDAAPVLVCAQGALVIMSTLDASQTGAFLVTLPK